MKGADVSAPWLSDLTTFGLGSSHGSNRKRYRSYRLSDDIECMEINFTCWSDIFCDGFLLDLFELEA